MITTLYAQVSLTTMLRLCCVRSLFPSYVLTLLPVLRSTPITVLPHYYNRLSHPYIISKALCFGTCTSNTCFARARVIRTSQVASSISTNSLTPETPVVINCWISLVWPPVYYCLLPCVGHQLPQPRKFRGYHVHHLVSARMFRCLRFTAFVT